MKAKITGIIEGENGDENARRRAIEGFKNGNINFDAQNTRTVTSKRIKYEFKINFPRLKHF